MGTGSIGSVERRQGAVLLGGALHAPKVERRRRNREASPAHTADWFAAMHALERTVDFDAIAGLLRAGARERLEALKDWHVLTDGLNRLWEIQRQRCA
jgi:hypothetical protein